MAGVFAHVLAVRRRVAWRPRGRRALGTPKIFLVPLAVVLGFIGVVPVPVSFAFHGSFSGGHMPRHSQSVNPQIRPDARLATLAALAAPTITGFAPTSGAPGTSVVITGANLTGATAVSFNGTAASSFTVNSDTQITAVVPATATSGAISVTTPSGTASSGSSYGTKRPRGCLASAPRTRSGTTATKSSAAGTNWALVSFSL